MAKCKSKRCRCYKSYMSSQCDSCSDCFDVCTKAPCGDPQYLTTLTPVIYDQVGINLCNTITLTPDISTTYPTAVKATVRVINIDIPTVSTTTDVVTVTPIANRPNCYTVTLTNLTVSLAILLYDCCNRLLATLPVTATYLPPSTTAAGYDEDTNPTSVTLEIYAPYGISYNDATLTSPAITYLGFIPTSATHNGLNMTSVGKVLSLDVDDNTVTIGLSLYLQSIYYIPYKLCHNGKSKAPKASMSSDEDSLCMSFVEGDLLNMNIKPLELDPPKCECRYKKECPDPSNTCDEQTDTANTCGCYESATTTTTSRSTTTPETGGSTT